MPAQPSSTIRVTQKPDEVFLSGRRKCARCGLERNTSTRIKHPYCGACIGYARSDGWTDDE